MRLKTLLLLIVAFGVSCKSTPIITVEPVLTAPTVTVAQPLPEPVPDPVIVESVTVAPVPIVIAEVPVPTPIPHKKHHWKRHKHTLDEISAHADDPVPTAPQPSYPNAKRNLLIWVYLLSICAIGLILALGWPRRKR